MLFIWIKYISLKMMCCRMIHGYSSLKPNENIRIVTWLIGFIIYLCPRLLIDVIYQFPMVYLGLALSNTSRHDWWNSRHEALQSCFRELNYGINLKIIPTDIEIWLKMDFDKLCWMDLWAFQPGLTTANPPIC